MSTADRAIERPIEPATVADPRAASDPPAAAAVPAAPAAPAATRAPAAPSAPPSAPPDNVVYDLDEVDGFTTAPSDQLVLAALQRMASAQAQLLTAEESAARAPAPLAARIHQIEETQADVVWATARSLATSRSRKTEAALREANERAKAALASHGYASFKAYLTVRTETPTEDVHLQLARREYSLARQEWERVQRDLEAARLPTAVVDYTEDEPRPID